MLASETDRRAPLIIDGARSMAEQGANDPDKVEEMRVEAHGLKGAAMVVGEKRLARLGELMEIALVQRVGPGTVDAELAAALAQAVGAFQEGTRASAAGDGEPDSVGESIAALETLSDG